MEAEIQGVRNLYGGAVQNVRVFTEMGMTKAADAARNTVRTLQPIIDRLNSILSQLRVPNGTQIDLLDFSNFYGRILSNINSELPERLR